jgi:phosphate starvation-inducible protein PhoH
LISLKKKIIKIDFINTQKKVLVRSTHVKKFFDSKKFIDEKKFFEEKTRRG